MKTMFSTILIAVLVLGVLLALSPGKAYAWYRGPVVGFSVVMPPFGVSIGAPAPYYYNPGPVYVEPPYPVYRRYYYPPYYGPYYRPSFRHRYWNHRSWRGDWDRRGYGRGHGHWRY